MTIKIELHIDNIFKILLEFIKIAITIIAILSSLC